ncbi:MAG TPA: S41 family peptidase [Deinococcales bacterium]|nr:S41 family peptidase [Deinococcales bacterium]
MPSKLATVRAATVAAVLAAAAVAPALASPAQDLFDQATFYAGFYYNGPGPNPGFRALRAQYQARLDAACGSDANCPYDKAVPIIRDIIASFQDPFTSLMSGQEVFDQDLLTQGKGPTGPRLGLIGADWGSNGVVVERVFPGEAADAAGLQRGDVIQSVNGAPATAQALQAPAALTLGVKRGTTDKRLELTAQPARQGLIPTYSTLAGGSVGLIWVPDLYANGIVGDTVQQLAHRATQAGVKGLIIDLRDADTGLDTEALVAAAAFTPKAGFIYQPRFAGTKETYTVDGQSIYAQAETGDKAEQAKLRYPADTTTPLVVLVNARTTNSAEMLAYMLQHADRAKVVGEPTRGELSVSGGAIGDLINGDYVNVSEMRMVNLDGSNFPRQVTPDVVVADDPAALAAGQDKPLDAALSLLGQGSR